MATLKINGLVETRGIERDCEEQIIVGDVVALCACTKFVMTRAYFLVDGMNEMDWAFIQRLEGQSWLCDNRIHEHRRVIGMIVGR